MGTHTDPPVGHPAGTTLDNPTWASLTGVHARFAEAHGRAARYQSDVAPFSAVADLADPAAWVELGELAGPGGQVMVAAPRRIPVPSTWEQVFTLAGVQMVDTSVRAERDPEAIELGAADVPELLDPVARARPGQFLHRLHPPGWTEISAVCTDAEHRGQGITSRLIHDAVATIRARGETPFLHTAADNAGAIRLYESLGFSLHSETFFQRWLIPDQS